MSGSYDNAMPVSSRWLGLILLVALLPTGAVAAWERGALHACLGVALAWHAWRKVAFTPTGAASLVCVGLALLPGLFSAGRPDLVVDGFSTWQMVVGAWVVTLLARDAWGFARLRSALAWSGLGFALFGALHAGLGLHKLMGVVSVRQHDGLFWAPMVNPNHHGTVLVMLWPLMFQEARQAMERHAGFRAAVFCAGTVWAGVFALLTASMGLLVALGLQIAVLALLGPWGWRGRLAGLVAMGAAVVGGARVVLEQQPEWWELSGGPRWTQWSDSWSMLAAHKVFGVGAGNYGVAYPPFRTVWQFAVLDHLHADLLQWCVETGLVGCAAAALALWWAPWGRIRGETAALGLGLAGGVGHALVDFPFHVPGVMVLAVVLAAAWSSEKGAAKTGGGTLVVLALLQLLAAGWWQRRAVEDEVAAAVLAQTATADEVSWLRTAAPWRAEPAAMALSKATDPREVAREALAAHPHDGALARLAAARLHAAGHLEEADLALSQSLAADPSDYRTWWLRSTWKAATGDNLGAAQDRVEAFRRWPRERLVDEETFKKAYALFPLALWWLDALSDAPAHWTVRLAWQALKEKNYEVVLLAAEQAARLRPAVHAWMPARAEAMAGLGQPDAAIAWTRSWLSAEPQALWGWMTLAKLGDSEGRPELVGEGLSRAMLLEGEQPRIWRAAEGYLARVPACPGAHCAPGGPAWELARALRSRHEGDVLGCEASVREAAWGGDWALRVSQAKWSCRP